MSARHTPLHAEHLRLNARIVPFHGWELPVQFSGLVDEHQAVRNAAGLFDLSHMGEIACEGTGALEALNRVVTNDLRKVREGQAQYNAMLRPDGGIIDDLVVYRIDTERWLLVVNASNQKKDFAWVREHIPSEVLVEDRSDQTAQLALQGPLAQEILGELTTVDLSEIGFYRFTMGTVAGHEALISRTGYTGEDGFEIYLSAETAPPPVWRAILEAGTRRGLLPVGLGARDSLRLEMKFALYGNDIDETTNPLEAGLRWIVKLKKGDFIGRDALLQIRKDGIRRRLVGMEVVGRGIARPGFGVLARGREVGQVTSGTFSPSLRKPIAIAYVETGLHEPSTKLQVEIRKRAVDAVVVETPFYHRAGR